MRVSNIPIEQPLILHNKRGIDSSYKLILSKNQNQSIAPKGNDISVGEEKLVEWIEQLNKKLIKPPTDLQISIHEKTKRISIKIINTETNEIIKEISPEKVLDMVAKMWEIAGIIIDERI